MKGNKGKNPTAGAKAGPPKSGAGAAGPRQAGTASMTQSLTFKVLILTPFYR